jgi:hypothetical protein
MKLLVASEIYDMADDFPPETTHTLALEWLCYQRREWL